MSVETQGDLQIWDPPSHPKAGIDITPVCKTDKASVRSLLAMRRCLRREEGTFPLNKSQQTGEGKVSVGLQGPRFGMLPFRYLIKKLGGILE